MSDFSALLPALLALVQEAGRDIMAIYRDEPRWAVQKKDDDSPLTAADLASHQCLLPGLQALTPDIPVISEEGEEIAFAERRQWPRCWLVDPLDGTKEFIARSDEFSINVALIENTVAVLGLVYSPVTQTAYVAARGAGAWRYSAGESRRLQVAAWPQAGAALQVVASRRHRGGRDQAFAEAVAAQLAPVTLTQAGSAFKICAVAEGLAHVYPRFGATMEWDTAAGQIIVEEAGGCLLDAQGRPFRYNARTSLRNDSFLVAGAAPVRCLPLWMQLAGAH